MSEVIDDGWNRDGFIKPADKDDNGKRIHNGLSFTYRTVTRRQIILNEKKVARAQYEHVDDLESLHAETVVCDFVAKQIQAWDLKDVKGKSAPVNSDSMFDIIHPYVFNELYGIITQKRLPDVKPGSTEQPKSDDENLGNSEAASGSN